MRNLLISHSISPFSQEMKPWSHFLVHNTYIKSLYSLCFLKIYIGLIFSFNICFFSSCRCHNLFNSLFQDLLLTLENIKLLLDFHIIFSFTSQWINIGRLVYLLPAIHWSFLQFNTCLRGVLEEDSIQWVPFWSTNQAVEFNISPS